MRWLSTISVTQVLNMLRVELVSSKTWHLGFGIGRKLEAESLVSGPQYLEFGVGVYHSP